MMPNFMQMFTQNHQYVKHLKKEHNPLNGCESISLGTFEYYRNLYDGEQFVGDVREGNVQMQIGSNFLNNSILIPEGYIYSYSYEQVKSEYIDKSYDDYFFINNRIEFRKLISKSLKACLKIDDFQPLVQERLINLDFSEIEIIEIDKGVQYPNLNEGHIIMPFFDMFDLIRLVGFIKHNNPFVHQKEMRFGFFPYHPKLGFIDVLPKNKIVPIEGFKNLDYINKKQRRVAFINNLIGGVRRNKETPPDL